MLKKDNYNVTYSKIDLEMRKLSSKRIKIVYRNNYERIVDPVNVRNYNSLESWIEDFNNDLPVPSLTLFGRDLGSNFSINKTNVKTIEYID